MNRDAVHVPAGITPTGNGLPVTAADAEALGGLKGGADEGDAKLMVGEEARTADGVDVAGVVDPHPVVNAIAIPRLTRVRLRIFIPLSCLFVADHRTRRVPKRLASQHSLAASLPIRYRCHDRSTATGPGRVVIVGDRWSGGDSYERYVGRWSRLVAPIFVDWLAIGPGQHWLDVGCGTGALSAIVLAQASPASVVGIDPSADFVAHARQRVTDPRASFAVGDAQAIPLDAGSVDVVVAGLVLNFVADPAAGLAEMVRVAVPSATVAAYVWDYAQGMQLMHHFFDAAIALDPAAMAEDEGVRFPICAPGPLKQAFAAAGLGAVAVRSIEVPTVFASFDDYWAPFLSGVGAAPAFAMRLDEEHRNAIRDRLRATLPTEADGSIHLSARAWAARGTRA